jgi:hypothetical protein
MSSKSFITLIIMALVCATIVICGVLISFILSWANLHLLINIGVSLIMFGSLVFYGIAIVNGALLIREARLWDDEEI